MLLRKAYRALVPYEWRFWFYTARNRRNAESMRSNVFASPKGDFSLRKCDELSAIFIHVPKAAGTSVALALFGELPYHYTAIEHRVIFGRRLFNQYFKFAFVRNPWDRLYSAYSYLRAGGWDKNDRAWYASHLARIPDFDTFVLDWLDESRLQSHMHFRPQYEFICSRSGEILLDHLGYFETLRVDFAKIAQRIGAHGGLAHQNASPREDYRAAYSLQSRAVVADVYARDIELFGYDFNGVRQRKRADEGQLIAA